MQRLKAFWKDQFDEEREFSVNESVDSLAFDDLTKEEFIEKFDLHSTVFDQDLTVGQLLSKLGQESVDLLIIGAGVSGIGLAKRLQDSFPGKKIQILEAGPAIGGTWLLHQYPGTRTDSDTFTYGYDFMPWDIGVSATREEILDYMDRVVETNNLKHLIKFNHRVKACSWSTAQGRWNVESENGKEFGAKFLFVCTGYYTLEKPNQPQFKGMEKFKGGWIHPQNWPKDVTLKSLTGKRVVIIGSGATAVSVAPAIAEACENLMVLQRSSQYFDTSKYELEEAHKELKASGKDATQIYSTMRGKCIANQFATFDASRTDADTLKQEFLSNMRELLDQETIDEHFTPDYPPWFKRVLYAPKSFFKQIRDGEIKYVTAHLASIDAQGILLEDGSRLDCDYIISATGFGERCLAANIPFVVDGSDVSLKKRQIYNGLLPDALPNCAILNGYTHFAWTLRIEIQSEFLCRMLKFMNNNRHEIVIPAHVQSSGGSTTPSAAVYLPSWMRRSIATFPRPSAAPWDSVADFVFEKPRLEAVDFKVEGCLKFSK